MRHAKGLCSFVTPLESTHSTRFLWLRLSPQWRNLASYLLVAALLVFAILYTTVISKRGRQEP
jgi:hypothetical protein